MSDNHIDIKVIIPEEHSGLRLDVALAKLLPDYSRARIQGWIANHEVKVNGQVLQAKDKIEGGETVEIYAKLEDEGDWQAQDMPVNVIYADDHIIVINKPVGLIVHPGAGVKNNTLVNALLYHYPELKKLPRAGVVHRLDKDTSGLMVVARSIKAHTHLVNALQQRTVKRIYHAVANGVILKNGTVDAPVGRHPKNRLRMAVVDTGKPAVTHFSVLEPFHEQTYIKCQLETGRTHQIRVHMAHIGHPLFGDQTYGPHMRISKHWSTQDVARLKRFKRQALHAAELSFEHPDNKEFLTFTSSIPDDMQAVIDILRRESHA